MTITKLERTRQAFTSDVYQQALNKGYEFPRLEEGFSYSVSISAEIAAKKLLLAIETYRAAINELEWFGEIHSTPEELAKLIFDYDQDEVGHKATDFLRAAVEEN